MAHDFSGIVKHCAEIPGSIDAKENYFEGGAKEIGAGRHRRNEERACAILQFPRWSSHPADKWEDLLGLQCRKRVVWNDELRRADGNFFSRGRVGAED